MTPDGRQVVVVTGGSAGVGRATVREFGGDGAAVAILARGEAGIEAAAEDVLQLGGTALAISTDVADNDAVEAAAQQVEDELGPIDVWVNVAFSSVFANFLDISPEEFERTTQVTYMGYVNGTRAALKRMVPRNRGSVIQVGSALAYRGIPLQSAYCGSKHAIQGFTESVRCELINAKSKVRISEVHLPAVNTPQFRWVLSRLPMHAQPVPPIFQPEIPARAILHASKTYRREWWIGGPTVATLLGNRIVPGLLDHYLGRTGFKSQQTPNKNDANRPANLFAPVDNDKDWGAHGGFDAEATNKSYQVALSKHRRFVWGAVAAAITGIAASGRR